MSSFRPLLIMLSILFFRLAAANEPVHPPEEDSSWPIRVFAEADSFSVRYHQFFSAHFGSLVREGLPEWTDLDLDSLTPGGHVLARPARIDGNEDAILARLREVVSLSDEIGMTQFSPQPGFSSQYFVLGREDEVLTLVPYNVWGVQDTLADMEVLHHLAGQGAFLTHGEDSRDVVVLGRGSITEVDLWHPVLAAEVLHAHTIPGNINPTGYLEFTEGSDRDLILTSYRFQEPFRKLNLVGRK